MNSRISHETSSRTNLPRWFRSTDDNYYEIESFTPDGKIRYRGVNSSFEVDPNKDFREIIEEGIENGVFTGNGSVSENPQGTVLRSEAIFELCRTFGTTEDLRDIGHDVSEEVMREVDQLAGEESYYRAAVAWFLSQNEYALLGMYNYRDLEGPITWLEFSYWWFVGLRNPSPKKWSTINPKDTNVSVVTHVRNGKKRLDDKFASYKQSSWMKSYLNDIRRGKRYIPFPALCSFVNMKESGILPSTEPETKMVDNLPVQVESGIDVEKNDWCLLEMSRSDFTKAVSSLNK